MRGAEGLNCATRRAATHGSNSVSISLSLSPPQRRAPICFFHTFHSLSLTFCPLSALASTPTTHILFYSIPHFAVLACPPSHLCLCHVDWWHFSVFRPEERPASISHRSSYLHFSAEIGRLDPLQKKKINKGRDMCQFRGLRLTIDSINSGTILLGSH